jgi:hypothetical protein
MRKSIGVVIFVAFLVRLSLLVINVNWFQFPEARFDAVRFERLAWQATQVNTSLADKYAESGAGAFVKLGSILYSAVGRSPNLWAFILVLLGTITVYNIYKATYLLWNDKEQAVRVAWFAAFFPEFAMLSSILLREVLIHFFLSLAVISFIRFWKYKSKVSIIFFIIYIGLCTMFHSAMIVALGGLGVAVFMISQDGKKKSVFYKLIALSLVLGGLVLINSTGWGLNKFGGSLNNALDTFETQEGKEALGNAAYPAWLRIQGGVTDLWKLPIRLIAFVCAPALPFLVKNAAHLVGVLDALFYMLILYSIYKNWKVIRSNKTAYAIFVITASLAIVYSLGTSNFGTAIRHRAKILPLLLTLAIDYKGWRKKRMKKMALMKSLTTTQLA